MKNTYGDADIKDSTEIAAILRVAQLENELAALRANLATARETVAIQGEAITAMLNENKGLRAENAQLRGVLERHKDRIENCLAIPTEMMLYGEDLEEILFVIESTQPDPVYTAAPEMLELAKMVLRADAEANSGDYSAGMCDCKDNDGGRYQSEFLATTLKRIAALVDKVEVNPIPANEF